MYYWRYHIKKRKPHVEMIFRKAVKNLRNLASRNSVVSTSSPNKQVSTTSVPHQSSSKSGACTIYKPANKRKPPHREEGQTSKQNQPERKEELQPGDAPNLMFK